MTGIERIHRSFAGREHGKKTLITFLTAGDPNLEESEQHFLRALEYADILEIGIPFSDPLADGPVIQSSYGRALAGGTRISDVFALVKRIRAKTEKPLVFMTYINVLLQKGFENFINQAADCGIDGLIIPDLPPEEAGEVSNLAQGRGIAMNFLVAPTSTEQRIKTAVRASTGFVYIVSLRGVTGVRNELATDLPDFVHRVRCGTQLPLAVGFGISEPEQARTVSQMADGVIVGSALVRIMASESSFAERERLLTEKLDALKSAL